MQIYRFSLIFHSISELNKKKQPEFAKIFAGDGRSIIKVGVNHFLLYFFFLLAIVQKSSTSLCEFIHFISRLHVLHWVNTYGRVSWRSRMQCPEETNAVAGGDTFWTLITRDCCIIRAILFHNKKSNIIISFHMIWIANTYQLSLGLKWTMI